MTRIDFDKNLGDIDFSSGSNVERLEDFLLACLYQLDMYKQESPSYELFLKIYDQARSSITVEFDSCWNELNLNIESGIKEEENNLKDFEMVVNEIRSLVADLINTKEIRSQPGYIINETIFEWDSEGGVRFHNGTTPDSILRYAATRFEGEYSPQAYEEIDLSWQSFTDSLWIGILYE